MNARSVLVAVLALGVGIALTPLRGQDASSSSSGNDIFNSEESVTPATESPQNAAPRTDVLKEAVPRLTGTFTGSAGFAWNWSDIYNAPFGLFAPTSSTISQQGTDLAFGFVARPETDISFSGEIRTNYPFVQQITTASASTVVVPDVTVWSLYSKFTWNDALFFTFGKQPLKWGTGYFFSPADDVFAQTAADVANPTAEREGPLALKVQYPIPKTQDNLYFIASLPPSNDPTALAAMQPQDIAVAAKAEVLLGNTELAAAGYYQRQQRPEAILMGTTGFGNLNFFAEGLVAFPSTQPEAFIEKAPSPIAWTNPTTPPTPGTSNYTIVDRSGQTFAKATGGVMYINQDTNFTFVGQYLYNGQGYSSLSVQDILQALADRALGQPPGELPISAASIANTFGGLGRIGMHYGVVYLGWSSIADSKTGFSVLGIMNFSDGSGYVNPTVTFTTFTYLKLSVGASLSWGAAGTEFADPTGFSSFFPTINGLPNPNYNPNYVAKPTLSLTLSASIGTGSF